MNISQKKFMSTFMIIFLFATCSCSKAPAVQSFPASELSLLTDIDLCYKYYSTNREKAFTEKSRNEIEAELKKRGLMTDADLILIRKHKVKVGFSKYVMYASLGNHQSTPEPTIKHDNNIETIKEYYIFHNMNPFSFRPRATSVTIENGKVTKIVKISFNTSERFPNHPLQDKFGNKL